MVPGKDQEKVQETAPEREQVKEEGLVHPLDWEKVRGMVQGKVRAMGPEKVRGRVRGMAAEKATEMVRHLGTSLHPQ